MYKKFLLIFLFCFFNEILVSKSKYSSGFKDIEPEKLDGLSEKYKDLDEDDKYWAVVDHIENMPYDEETKKRLLKYVDSHASKIGEKRIEDEKMKRIQHEKENKNSQKKLINEVKKVTTTTLSPNQARIELMAKEREEALRENKMRNFLNVFHYDNKYEYPSFLKGFKSTKSAQLKPKSYSLPTG
jgi:hypothetical protein